MQSRFLAFAGLLRLRFERGLLGYEDGVNGTCFLYRTELLRRVNASALHEQAKENKEDEESAERHQVNAESPTIRLTVPGAQQAGEHGK